MRRLVRVFWGPRPESLDVLADRWLATLAAVDASIPAGPGSWQRVHPDGPPTGLPPGRAGLLAALGGARDGGDWSDVLGTGLRLTRAGAPGGEIEISGLAGGAPEFLLQSLVLTIGTPGDTSAAEADLLTRLAVVWEPDIGDVTDDRILDALEDGAGVAVGDPVIGRLGYLSAGRLARWPAVSDVAVRPVAGGAVVEVAGGPDAVVRAQLSLRAAGALDPLPRPMDRARL